MRKFKVPVVPRTTNKCIRMPNDIIAKIESEIEGKDCSFTAFVIEACKVALDNIEESKKQKSK
ncbi:MAG: hypothetical protein N2749_06360 [Clostridia bacterium]|nr:hypothetical protein [Clostridia bacterium]